MTNTGLLAQVQADQRTHNEPVRQPATPEALEALRKSALDQLNAELPGEYVEFLKRSDGLSYNSLAVYDSSSSPEHPGSGNFWQGFVPTNQLWRDDPDANDLLIVGDSDMDLYALHLPSQTWRRVDKIAFDTFEVFDSLDAMLNEALRNRL